MSEKTPQEVWLLWASGGRQARAETALEPAPRDPARPAHELPPPVIDETDRGDLDEAAWMSAAVALDVLATRLAPLKPSTGIIEAAVHRAVEVGALAGLAAQTLEALVEHAAGETGTRREQFTQYVRRKARAVAATPANPSDVHAAVQRLVLGARTLVHEARIAAETAASLELNRI